MAVSFYIAKRYLVSKKSNNAVNIISWISIIAIAVTTGALIIILSAMNGLTSTVANLYNTFEPDIKITAAHGKYFDAQKSFLSEIGAIEGVRLISQTVSDKVLIKNIDKQTLVTMKGVDPRFSDITQIKEAIKIGSYDLNNNDHKIVLGSGVANQLDVNMNVFVNELSMYSPVKGKVSALNPEDNLNQMYCTPVGIFSLNDDLDYAYAFTNLKTARELLDLSDKQVSALELLCDEGKADKVKSRLKEKLGNDFIVKNRYELNDVLFKSLETEKLATFIILAFVLVIATFNIIGALTMLIIEKRKDIKTLYCLGADLNLIRGIFMREALLISGSGAIIGLLLGLGVCWLQIKFHLVKFGSEFIIAYYPIELQLKDFVWIFGMIMCIGFFAALYPVRVFTKQDLVH